MFIRTSAVVGSLFVAGLLAGCAQPPYYQQQSAYPQSYPAAPAPAPYTDYGSPVNSGYQSAAPVNSEYGRVSNIEMMQSEQHRAPSGVGAILGGVLGAVVGNQIGHGMGRAAATGVGVLGGAVAGNALEGNQRGSVVQTYRISVQTDNGQMQVFDVPTPGDLRIGDRVRLDNGRIQRI